MAIATLNRAAPRALSTRAVAVVLFAILIAVAPPAARGEATLPDPDGKPADMTKPVKVFILMGQSNMLGFGKVQGADKDGTLEHAVKAKDLYPFLVDDAGNWTERKDVRNVRVMNGRGGGMGVHNNEWMTIKGGKIGPEIGIGYELGTLLDEPVLILKSCIGNRSLGWDLLPPGGEQFEFEEKQKDGSTKTMVYAGYKDATMKWEKGSKPKPGGWYAGKQWDTDIANAKKVLEEIETYYPGAKGYEVAGFFWWQGDKDRYNPGHAAMYERNLVLLLEALRKEFDAPDAPLVIATLGQTDRDAAKGTEKDIIEGMFAISDPGKYPQYKGEVATVYTHPLSKGGASNGHYGGNAETYMNVGLGMGEAMVELLEAAK